MKTYVLPLRGFHPSRRGKREEEKGEKLVGKEDREEMGKGRREIRGGRPFIPLAQFVFPNQLSAAPSGAISGIS